MKGLPVGWVVLPGSNDPSGMSIDLTHDFDNTPFGDIEEFEGPREHMTFG